MDEMTFINTRFPSINVFSFLVDDGLSWKLTYLKCRFSVGFDVFKDPESTSANIGSEDKPGENEKSTSSYTQVDPKIIALMIFDLL